MYTYTEIQITRKGQTVTAYVCNDAYADWVIVKGDTRIVMTYTAPEIGQDVDTLQSEHNVHLTEPVNDIQTFGVVMESFNR